MSAVRILEVRDDPEMTPRFLSATKDLKKILSHKRIADKKVSVISVAGAYRKGKSFLLNYFLRYLQWKCGEPGVEQRDNDEWLSLNKQQIGFSCKSGSERDTNGILIWSEPFILKDKDGEEVVILLMDTQGSFDSQSTIRDCATIFALSTMISSTQIYNLSQNIQEDNLQHLQLFAEFGRLALEDKMTSKPFQYLLFLVRDWQYPKEKEYGFSGGRLLLDAKLKIAPNAHEEMRQLRKHIDICFEYISCFLMPHPGKHIATDCGSEEIDPDFTKQLKVLIPEVLNPHNLVIKEMNGKKITCEELLTYFEVYMKIFQGNKLPTPKTAFEATAEGHNLVAIKNAREVYHIQMEAICGGGIPYISPENLTKEHHRAMTAATEHFKTAKKMGGIDQTYLKMLEKDITECFNRYEKTNAGKSIFRRIRAPMTLVSLFISSVIAPLFVPLEIAAAAAVQYAGQYAGLSVVLPILYTGLPIFFASLLCMWLYGAITGKFRYLNVLMEHLMDILICVLTLPFGILSIFNRATSNSNNISASTVNAEDVNNVGNCAVVDNVEKFEVENYVENFGVASNNEKPELENNVESIDVAENVKNSDLANNVEQLEVVKENGFFEGVITPALQFALLIIVATCEMGFQTLGITKIAEIFYWLKMYILGAITVWTYSRCTGRLVTARTWIDDATMFIYGSAVHSYRTRFAN